MILDTTAGDLQLDEVELSIASKTWNVLHAGAVISHEQELEFLLGESKTTKPYGAVLWPSSLALAHEVAMRGVRGKKILELGAGTGLPGIVAASLGARVVQTDRQNLVLHVCKLNAARNGVAPEQLQQRIADWTAWTDTEQYDLIIGSDILYAEPLHPFLRQIFDTNLAHRGTVLIADPYREPSMKLFHAMEADRWNVRLDKWSLAVTPPARSVGVFTLTRD
jgi:predicted nicotinamide N-methyase